MHARDIIEDQGFDCKGTDFTLTFSVPVSILLRELGLVHWLARKHPDLSFKHLVDIDSYQGVKRLLKTAAPQSLCKAFESKVRTPGLVCASVCVPRWRRPSPLTSRSRSPSCLASSIVGSPLTCLNVFSFFCVSAW